MKGRRPWFRYEGSSHCWLTQPKLNCPLRSMTITVLSSRNISRTRRCRILVAHSKTTPRIGSAPVLSSFAEIAERDSLEAPAQSQRCCSCLRGEDFRMQMEAPERRWKRCPGAGRRKNRFRRPPVRPDQAMCARPCAFFAVRAPGITVG